jgi:putative ABC transport system permease protein
LHRDLGPAGLDSMLRPDSVLIPEQMADRLGLAIENTLPVQTAHGAKHLRVGGLLRLGGLGEAFADALIVADLGLADEILSRFGRIDRIDVITLESFALDEVQARVRAHLPPGAQIQPPRWELAGRVHLAKAFIGITGAVSVFGLIVGFFLIYNVLSAAIVAEAQGLARLRLQGATRRDLITLLLAQAGWQAVPGVILGGGLGVMMGAAAQLPFLQGLGSITQLRISADVAQVSWSSVFGVALLGLPTAVLAGWLATHRRVAASPLHVVTGASAPLDAERRAHWAGRASLWLIVAASVFLALEVIHDSPIWGLLAISTVSALVVTGPAALVSSTANLVRPLLTRFGGLSGELAADGLLQSLNRSAVTIAVFALGIGTATCTTTIFNSAESLVLNVLTSAFRGDVFVTSAFRQQGWIEAPLSAAMAEEVSEVDGVRSVQTERIRSIAYAGHPVTLRVVEVGDSTAPRWVFVQGDPESVTLAWTAGRGVLVSRNFAYHNAVGPGDDVEVQGNDARRSFEVLGVVEDFASAEGSIVMTRAQAVTLWDDPLVTHISITTEAESSPRDVISAIQARLGDRYALRIVSLADFLGEARTLVARVFHFSRGVTGVVLAIATIVLLQSVVSGALERRRLLSLFRAIGASRRHLLGMFVLQGLTLGAIGAGLGLVAGALLSLIWMHIHLTHLLDWVVPIVWPWQTYASVGIVAVLWSGFIALVAARSLVRLPRATDLLAD